MSELFETKEHEVYTAVDDVEIVQLVGLKLGDEEYAIDVLKIQEIIRTVEITVVPKMDNFILGVMNLRGKVIPVIDLRIRFSLDRCDFDKSTRIIVVRFEKQNIGFVVDEVTEVIRISRSMVEPTPPLVGSIGQEYILGICKYDTRLIMLLDIDRVISENGEYIESDLRKKMLGSATKITDNPLLEGGHNDTPIEDHSQDQSGKSDTAQEVEEAPKSAAGEIKAPTITIEEEEITSIKLDDLDDDKEELTGSLDDMIAAELAKREAETEELNKKKKVTQT